MKFLDFFKKIESIPPGLYSGRFQIEEKFFKAHLRIENDKKGILSINASKILRLNETATEMVYHFINGKSVDETIKIMKKRYRVKKEILRKDVENLHKVLLTLGTRDDVCPLTDLGINLEEPYSQEFMAPLRFDLALTYRCQNSCFHCYNEANRKKEELSKAHWIEILKKVEKIGVPHVVFTGGEPTLVEFLPELISFAENLGLVTGLNTNGRKLKDMDYCKRLKDGGIDHIQITLEGTKKEIHDKIVDEKGSFEETIEGIKNSKDLNIFVMTNTTILKENKEDILNLPEFIKSLGINTFAVNSIIYSGKGLNCKKGLEKEELLKILNEISKKTRELGLKFIWYTPTRYCELNPLELGLGVKQCTAARVSMAIEPDGDVIPCQSYYESVGNILKDKWTKIWNHPLCLNLRKPQMPLKDCENCSLLSLCGGGCPLENRYTIFCCKEILSSGG